MSSSEAQKVEIMEEDAAEAKQNKPKPVKTIVKKARKRNVNTEKKDLEVAAAAANLALAQYMLKFDEAAWDRKTAAHEESLLTAVDTPISETLETI
jgi:hypothetical protein